MSKKNTEITENSIRDYVNDIEMTNQDIERNKQATASLFDRIGGDLYREIENKQELKEQERLKMIKFIKKRKKDISINELNDMTYEEVKSIYTKVKSLKRKRFQMLLDFLMGW